MGKVDVYRVSRLLPIMLIAGYAAVAFTVKHPNGIEVFPFFKWTLFSISSDVRSRVAIQLRSIDGRPLAEPRLYYDMPEVFIHARERDPNLQKAAGRLLNALKTEQPYWEESMRRVIEHRFLAESDAADYDLVVLTYNPLERLRSGGVPAINVLASYRKRPDG